MHLRPIVSHIAVKPRAYSIPRKRPNSRIKDLPDLALLASAGEIEAAHLRTALETTFEFRGTHARPHELTAPPAAWADAYQAMAAADGLAWATLEQVHRAAGSFLVPVLGQGRKRGRWDPHSWNWVLSSERGLAMPGVARTACGTIAAGAPADGSSRLLLALCVSAVVAAIGQAARAEFYEAARLTRPQHFSRHCRTWRRTRHAFGTPHHRRHARNGRSEKI